MTAAAERGRTPVVMSPRVATKAAKRVIDIALGSALAAAAVPVILVLAVAVCFSLRTLRPFFFQQRVGVGGRWFTVPKLRTLPWHAPTSADKYAIAGIQMSRLGRFLRRTHLDELPQLVLVPLGRMSLVGPRPEMPSLLERFSPDFASARSSVRPGCSGLWQISPDAHRLIWERPEYDLFYLSNATVRLDLWILWRTLLTLSGAGRAVTCADVPPWAVRGRRRQRLAEDLRPRYGIGIVDPSDLPLPNLSRSQ